MIKKSTSAVIEKILLTLLLSFTMQAALIAQSVVQGRVVDNENTPLPGAVVVLKGTGEGTSCDLDGRFWIEIKSDEGVLIVSMLGFKDKEVLVKGNDNIHIIMELDTETLAETVVIGYGTAYKKDLTGAVGVVKGDEIGKFGVSSANNVLQGMVAGVSVSSTSGTPGGTSVARIRGLGSINNSSTPLYVIDGLPQGSMDHVNPTEIESITVHKDASAVAIYGSRAANGVILVTTKSGKAGRAVVSYDGYAGVQNAWRRPYMLDAEEYITYSNLAHDNGGAARVNAFAAEEDIQNILNFVQKNIGSRKGTDWWNEITDRNAVIHNHTLSIAGGTDAVKYNIGASYLDQNGIVMGTNFKRLNVRSALDIKINDSVSLKTNFDIINQKSKFTDENNPFTGTIFMAMAADPITPVYRNWLTDVPDGIRNQIYAGYDAANPYSQFSGIIFNNKLNPVAYAKRMSLNTNSSIALKGVVNLEVKFTDYLKSNTRVGVDVSRGAYTGFIPYYNLSVSDYAELNTVTSNNSTIDYYVIEQVFSFDKQFDKLRLGVLLGGSVEDTEVSTTNASIQGTPNNDLSMAILNAGTINPRVTGHPYGYSLSSGFSRLTLNFDERYLLAINMRADGSSRFAAGHKWGFFPSVSGAWRLSEESFMENTRSWLSEAKVRVSYGLIGNQNVSGGAYQTTYGSSRYTRYQFGDSDTVYIAAGRISVGNESIKWEASKQFDLGVDLAFSKNRLDLTADYFRKEINDMLLKEPMPTTLGFQNDPWANVGTMLNKGWEFSVGWKDSIRDFSYGISGNISTYDNVVTSLGNGGAIFESYSSMVLTKTEVGMPVGYFFGYKTNGIFQNEEQLEGSPQRHDEFAGSTPGDIRFKDMNGDDVINESDRTYIGSPWPDFVYGMTLNLGYRGFDMSAFLQGSQGNDVMNLKMYYLESGEGYYNAPAGFLQRSWNGENSTDRFHKISTIQEFAGYVSDYFVEDGSFFRLKNFQLGYTLPSRLTSSVGISSLRFYVNAQNLLTLTKYSGLDPEMGSSSQLLSGVDLGFYPQARTFTLGVNIKF